LKTETLLARVDALIAVARKGLSQVRRSDYGSYVPAEIFTELRSSSLSFIEATFGRAHSYYSEFESKVTDTSDYYTEYAVGILAAIRNEIASGWLTRVKALVAEEFFADFLEMAAHLLDQGFKDAAAVLAGGTLEEHLRRLATATGIATSEPKDGKDVPRKANALNSELRAKDRYSLLDNKSIGSWLDLRNNAAHGHYNKYTAAQVEIMIAGVRDFVARTPA